MKFLKIVLISLILLVLISYKSYASIASVNTNTNLDQNYITAFEYNDMNVISLLDILVEYNMKFSFYNFEKFIKNDFEYYDLMIGYVSFLYFDFSEIDNSILFIHKKYIYICQNITIPIPSSSILLFSAIVIIMFMNTRRHYN